MTDHYADVWRYAMMEERGMLMGFPKETMGSNQMIRTVAYALEAEFLKGIGDNPSGEMVWPRLAKVAIKAMSNLLAEKSE